MGPTEIEQHQQIQTQESGSPPNCRYVGHFLNKSGNNDVDAPAPSSNQQSFPSSSASSASQRQLRSEALRLATFQGWPLDYLPPRELAAAGFFYLGIADQTRCAFCLITISQWEPQDSPATEHRRHAPNCPFVMGLPVGNVPISMGTSSSSSSSTETSTARPEVRAAPSSSSILSTRPLPLLMTGMSGGDICSRFQNESRPNALPEQALASSSLSIRPSPPPEEGSSFAVAGPSSSTLSSLHVLPHQPARRPELSSLEARMNTFADWPPGLEQRPAQLAQAGFYYMKTGDHVKCFCCDGALRNWEPKDDPWMEHARWFSRCNYLITVKGEEYVKEIKAKFQSNPASITQTEDIVEVKDKSASPEPRPIPAKSVAEEEEDEGLSISPASSKLRDATLCQICCDQQLSMVFLPCGHAMSCPSCATALTNCPLCRKRIEATVRAYFPFAS